MSYLEFPRSLSIQNLSNKDLKNLIRNNEYYSSCYIVIHEENFVGLDILNLSENKLTALKLPQWLTQKLISLKETLLKNPELLQRSEEDTKREDPRKNIPNKTQFRKTSTTKKKPNIDFTYDEDNYLNPNSMKRPKEINSDKIELKKTGLLKFSYRKSPEVPSFPQRKPEVIPRSDENVEENTYEPPPRHLPNLPVPSKMLPPPPPEDVADDYELPPRFQSKQSESIDPIDYDYIETPKEERPGKRKKSIFYIDSDLPPPLPDEAIPRRTENPKTFGNSLYVNTNESHTKIVSVGGHHSRPFSAKRPLPPLPIEANQSLKTNTTNRVIENKDFEADYEPTESETPDAETLPEYGNTELIEKTSIPTTKIPTNKNDFLNNLKSTIITRKHYLGDKGTKELQDKVQNRVGNREINRNDSRRDQHSPKLQLDLPKPPNALPKHVQSTYFGDISDNGNEDEISDNLPDYSNTEETVRTKQTTSKTHQQSLLAQEIALTKLKPTKSKNGFSNLSDKKMDVQEKRTTAKQPTGWKLHCEPEVEDLEDDQETLPEYGNTTEHTRIPFKQSEKISIQHKKSPITENNFLNNLKTKINQRTPNPFLGDKGSKELQEKVQNRIGSKESNMNDSRTEQTSSKVKPNLPKPPNALPKHVESTYFGETCDYGNEDESSENLPDYKNTDETIRTKQTISKTQHNLLAQEISMMRLKPTKSKNGLGYLSDKRMDVKEKRTTAKQPTSWKLHGEHEVEDLEDEQETLPEYGNSTEHTGMPFKQSEKTSIHQNKSPITENNFLNNLKTKINQRKPNSLLGDEGSRELQEKVQNRLGYRESKMNDFRTEQSSSKFQSNLPKPPNALPKHVESAYFGETCDYGNEDESLGSNNVSQLTLEISRKKLKHTTPNKEFQNFQEKRMDGKPKHSATEQPSSWKHHDKSEVDSFDQDDQPEYLNATDGQDISASSTPTEDFHLDHLADELRSWLQKRKMVKEEEYIEDEDDEFEQDDYDVGGAHRDLLNFNNEPFYRNTDRKGAIELLNDLEDGAFLLRPSRKFFLSITIKVNAKYFNLGIERTSNNKITCGEGEMKSQEFDSFKDFLDYFEHSPLVLQSERGLEEVYLRKVLPLDRY